VTEEDKIAAANAAAQRASKGGFAADMEDDIPF
jgi:hypothetical protein